MSGAGARLRPARAGDVEALAALDRAAGVHDWSTATYTAELARADRRWVVAEAGSRLVAIGGVADLAGDAHVLTVAVDPAHRRRRVGTLVVSGLLAAAVELGAARVTLEVRTGNHPARALYHRCGFEEAGVRPGYYRDGEDAVVLWCAEPPLALAALDLEDRTPVSIPAPAPEVP